MRNTNENMYGGQKNDHTLLLIYLWPVNSFINMPKYYNLMETVHQPTVPYAKLEK